MKTNKYRAVYFDWHNKDQYALWGWLKRMWGLDIWYGKIPVVKALILANILVWLLFV